jgi:hypothetical protein
MLEFKIYRLFLDTSNPLINRKTTETPLGEAVVKLDAEFDSF